MTHSGTRLGRDFVRTPELIKRSFDFARRTRKGAANIATRFAQRVISRIPRTALAGLNKFVGSRLVTKFGTSGTVNLGRATPIAGAIAGAAFDGRYT